VNETITSHNSQQIRSALRQNILFSRFSDEQFDQLCHHVKVVHIKKGDVLFNQGDEVHHFYFVFSGMIKLYRLSVDGNEKIFELESVGEIFAEALMFNEQSSYPVSAAALQNTTLLEINNQKFRQILSESFETSMMIMTDLSKRLHNLINEIDNLSLMTGRNRISTYFLEQALINGSEFTLEIPKNAIASILSLQPETFSRLLKELCSQNIIEVKENHIKVLDMKALRINAGIA
jgi:CRP/FNR family transcriptional regulator, dissimilatory nitrate respiration regulator